MPPGTIHLDHCPNSKAVGKEGSLKGELHLFQTSKRRTIPLNVHWEGNYMLHTPMEQHWSIQVVGKHV